MAIPDLNSTAFALLLCVVSALVLTDDRLAVLANPDNKLARWRVAGHALGFGGGNWAAHWTLMQAMGSTPAPEVPTLLIALSWAMVVAACALSAWTLRQSDSPLSFWLSGAMVSASLLALPLIHSFFLVRTIAFSPAYAVMGLACLLTGWGFIGRAWIATPVNGAKQAMATAGLGLGCLLGHWLGIHASGWPGAPATAAWSGVDMQTLALTSLVGHLVLLVMLMGMSALEQRMQRSIRQVEAAMHRQATNDPLTGLLNRQEFENQMSSMVLHPQSGGQPMALLFLDLDGFKVLNEERGNDTGNRVLRSVAERIQGQLGHGMLAGRWGSDQFVVCMPATGSKETVARMAQQLLGHVSALSVPDAAAVSASIGIAVYPTDGGLPLIASNAEQACRVAKQAGGGSYGFFDPKLVQDARDQAELLRELRAAVDLGQLQLYFQPKVHAPSGQITAAEALIRWNHPKRGFISPATFIPLAEKSGLILTIGDWIIEEVCRQIREWRNGGLRMRVAVNLSVQQLRHADLCEKIASALARHDVNPTLLTCEITESLAMEDTEATKTFFNRLAAVGVHISIDDFGTGYSSLAYLRQLPAQELKIDRGLVIDVATSNQARLVVDAVVKLGLALDMKVVAEGVETQEQYEVLRELGCVEIQGYLFAKPMNANMLYLWAMDDKSPSGAGFRDSLFQDTVLPGPL